MSHGTPENPRRSPRSRRIALLCLGIAAIAGVAVLGIRLYPWLRMPEEAEAEVGREWAELERIAAVTPGADDTLLLDAAEEAGKDPVRWTDEVPLLDASELTGRRQLALEKLEAWQAQGGGWEDGHVLGVPVADASLQQRRQRSVLGAVSLARLALVAAPADATQRAAAVLRLSSLMRTRGSLLAHVVGTRIALDVGLWVRARGAVPWPDVPRHRPAGGELFAALLRDAVATRRLLRDEAGGGLTRQPRSAVLPEVDGPPLDLVWMARERRVFDAFYVRLSRRLEGRFDDPAAVAGAYREAVATAPRSVVLRGALVDEGPVTRCAEQQRELAKLLPER